MDLPQVLQVRRSSQWAKGVKTGVKFGVNLVQTSAARLHAAVNRT
jgi:hypothetical protein